MPNHHSNIFSSCKKPNIILKSKILMLSIVLLENPIVIAIRKFFLMFLPSITNFDY